jgi:guanylate kinase
MHRGELFILSAPSGAGKTTLIRSLLNGGRPGEQGLVFSVSHTTRKPREGEVDGVDYHFVGRASFRSMIDEDRFLEWAPVHDQLYGTSWDEVLPRLDAGTDVLLDIDVQGAERVMARYPEAHSIFLMPPSFQDLAERLRRRGLDRPEQIAARLSVSLWEIERYDRYRYVIINDDAVRASEALAAIVVAARHRQERMLGRVREILDSFQDRSTSSPQA